MPVVNTATDQFNFKPNFNKPNESLEIQAYNDLLKFSGTQMAMEMQMRDLYRQHSDFLKLMKSMQKRKEALVLENSRLKEEVAEWKSKYKEEHARRVILNNFLEREHGSGGANKPDDSEAG